ncbi:MAG: hypothetical protein Q9162_003561 [Coniocarpon cinnabarinum]
MNGNAPLNDQMRFFEQDASCVKVTPIVCGTFTLPERAFVSPVDPDAKRLVPSLSFLIQHNGERTGVTRILFDLGLRGKPEAYTPEIQAHLNNRRPLNHNAASLILERNGFNPRSVDAVILSHVHWDHHGDPSDFAGATFVVGNGSMEVLEQGLPGRGSHSHFDPNLFKGCKVIELSDAKPSRNVITEPDSSMTGFATHLKDLQWDACAPFGATLDVFHDGSMFVIPAPGHLPGHINLICRTSPNRLMYLAGDAFHDERLLSGEKNIATWEDQGQYFCIHFDKAMAEETIDRIRQFQKLCDQAGVELEVVAAHDCDWLAANRVRCLE